MNLIRAPFLALGLTLIGVGLYLSLPESAALRGDTGVFGHVAPPSLKVRPPWDPASARRYLETLGDRASMLVPGGVLIESPLGGIAIEPPSGMRGLCVGTEVECGNPVSDPLDLAIAEQAREAFSAIEVEPRMLIGRTYELALYVERFGYEGIEVQLRSTAAPTAPAVDSETGRTLDPIQAIRVTGEADARASSAQLELTGLFQPGWRTLRSGVPTKWSWSVEPRQEGDASLTVELLQKVQVGADVYTATVNYFPRTVQVVVPPMTGGEQQMAEGQGGPSLNVAEESREDQAVPGAPGALAETKTGHVLKSGESRSRLAASQDFFDSLSKFATSLAGLLTAIGALVTTIASWSIWRNVRRGAAAT